MIGGGGGGGAVLQRPQLQPYWHVVVPALSQSLSVVA